MKRVITKLEENLIKNGWTLSHKTYTGKNRDKVLNYVYEKKAVEDFLSNNSNIIWRFRVLLNRKRTEVEDVLIKIPLQEFANDISLAFVSQKLQSVQDEVNKLYPTQENIINKEELSVEEEVQTAEVFGGCLKSL